MEFVVFLLPHTVSIGYSFRSDIAYYTIATDSCRVLNKQMTTTGQAPTAVSKPKIFGRRSRVRMMHNVASISKQY